MRGPKKRRLKPVRGLAPRSPAYHAGTSLSTLDGPKVRQVRGFFPAIVAIKIGVFTNQIRTMRRMKHLVAEPRRTHIPNRFWK